MRKTKQSERSRHGDDMISQLPDNVVDKILTSLPIDEAAKAAVLSKNWKRGWRNISVLEFDISFGEKFEKASRPNLMLAISRILFLHLGPIDGFTLSISWLESCAEINPLIQLLAEKKVKHLIIHFINGDSHVLPSYLFSCFQLSTLDLAGCVFNPPQSFEGFSQLITLVLEQVDITTDFFGMFISNCTLLQQLRLLKCSFREVPSFNIIAPNLRTFFYVGCKLFICFVSVPLLDQLTLGEFDYERNGARCLNFDGVKKLYLHEFCSSLPALRKLKVDYYFLKTLEVSNLLGESPNCLLQLKDLTVNDICFGDIEEVSSLVGLIRSSPNLERLTIWVQIAYDDAGINRYEVLGPEEYDFSCNKLQAIALFDVNGTNAEMTFIKSLLLKSPQLKEMTIRGVDASSLIGLIRNSPNLERLIIWMNWIRDDAVIDHYEVLGPEEYDLTCNKLQTVELIDFNGTNAEMAFVKVLLSKSPQLKEMIIGGVDEQKELQILRRMIRFHRASPTVDVNVYVCE